jgi:large subunit ribosomal protein L25
MKLNYISRAADKKSESKRLRRQGLIPAIIYHREKVGQAIAVNNNDYQAIIRRVVPGRLSTNIFTLVDENGAERKAILKEIQYKVTNYDVLHLDFEDLIEGHEVNVKVPIECTGVVDCIGVKLGGVLRQVIRYLRVRCLPKDIPTNFNLDVKTLNNRETRRLSDLEIPQTVRPLGDLNEVAVAIVKR